MFKRKKKYFYMISVESTMIEKRMTASGTFDWKGTENDAYSDRLENVCKKMGHSSNHVITKFWYMKPNKL